MRPLSAAARSVATSRKPCAKRQVVVMTPTVAAPVVVVTVMTEKGKGREKEQRRQNAGA